MKWAYVAGVLEAMLDWELKGYSERWDTLQDQVNAAFERYEQELKHESELAASRD
jgi:hypothetical protein